MNSADDQTTTSILKRALGSGRATMAVAAGWNAFDAVLHIVADLVEPLRVVGNVGVIAIAALTWVLAEHGRRGALAAATLCGLAAGLIIGLNGAWLALDGALRVPSFLLITITLLLLARAAWRFFGEAGEQAEQERL